MHRFAKRCFLCGGRANAELSDDPKEIGMVVRCSDCGTYGFTLSGDISREDRQYLAAYVRRETQNRRVMPVIRKDNWELLVRLGELLSARL